MRFGELVRQDTRRWWALAAVSRQAEHAAGREKDPALALNLRLYAEALTHYLDDKRGANERFAQCMRAEVMLNLKSLPYVTNAVHQFAVAFGVRTSFYNLDAIHAIAAKALQLFLDPNCPQCDGRGSTGGFLVPVKLCQCCHATGKRINGPKKTAFRLAASESGHQWGRRLLCELDRKCARVEDAMKLYLHSSRVGDEEWGAAQALELKRRLADLRSTEAERD
jgi:hypothetical protein